MKYTNTFLLIQFFIFLLIISCTKKELTNGKETEKDKPKSLVSFNVSNFSQNISPIDESNNVLLAESKTSVSSDSLKKVFSALACYILQRNVSTPYTKLIWQSNTSGNFGSLSDSIPYGKYTAYFAGVGSGAYVPTIFRSLPNISFLLQSGLSSFAISNSDCFVGDSVNFNIDGITQNKDLSVTMHRIVGLLRVLIEDDEPGLNLRLTVTPGVVNGFYKYSTGKYDTTAISERAGEFYEREGNRFRKIATGIYEIYMPYLNKSFPFLIEQLDSDNNTVIKSKKVDNIICQLNKVTTVSGKFFSESNGSNQKPSFNIDVDSNWSKDTIKIKF